MEYSFRIRFVRSPTDTIQTDASELELPSFGMARPIVLRARKDDLPIKDSDHLAVVGSGYESAEEAEIEGQKVKNALAVALARVRVGADFGHRAAKGMFTEHGLRWAEQQTGQRLLNNVHGLMVYESEPRPQFVSMNAQMQRGTTPEAFLDAYTTSLRIVPSISERDWLAYTLFNASFFQPTADTRFLLLVMSIEALIEPARRSNETVAHVETLIETTKRASLPIQEINSMVGTLRWLRKESINQAGRRLAQDRLGTRIYSDMCAADYFSYCYQLRSGLVHGNIPAPNFDVIGATAATLEVLVSDLLTSPILGCPS